MVKFGFVIIFIDYDFYYVGTFEDEIGFFYNEFGVFIGLLVFIFFFFKINVIEVIYVEKMVFDYFVQF